MQMANEIVWAYVVNAAWEVPLLALAAECTVRLGAGLRPASSHRLWVGCLLLSVVLPGLSLFPGHRRVEARTQVVGRVLAPVMEESDNRSFPPGMTTKKVGTVKPSAKAMHTSLPVSLWDRVAWQTQVPEVLCLLYLASVLFELLRLARGIVRAGRLLRGADRAQLTPELERTWRACLARFDDMSVELRSSDALSSPATLTWLRPVVILPMDLRGADAEELAAAFCHELAHVRRRDFALNLAFEALAAVLFFHPAMHWIQRRIRETREMVCDDLAAEALAGRVGYANGLLRLAQRMCPAAEEVRASSALGTFEMEMMERRVMNLIGPRVEQTRLRVSLCIALGLAMVLASSGLGVWLGVKPVFAQASIPQAAEPALAIVAPPVNVVPMAPVAAVPVVERPAESTPAAPAKGEEVPAGWGLFGDKPQNYRTGVDPQAMHDGMPSAFLASKAQDTGGFGTLSQYFSAQVYAGRRVRLRAAVRAKDVSDWAGLWLRVDKGEKSVAFDNMQNRAVKGTTGWNSYDVVLDVPRDATGIGMGVLLRGQGEVWIGSVKFETVSEDVKTTDQMTAPPAPRLGPVNLNFSGQGETPPAPTPNREMNRSVPIVMGEVRFKDGDSIVIDEIHGTSSELEHGNLYEIKGTYRLSSEASANLSVSITSNDRTPDPQMSLTSTIVPKGEGHFTVYKYVSSEQPGEMHMAFYPAKGGSSFGTAYFGSVNR